MQRQTYFPAHVQSTSTASATGDPEPTLPSNFDAQLDAILINPDFLATSEWLDRNGYRNSAHCALDAVTQSVVHEFEGGDDLWGMDGVVHVDVDSNHNDRENSVMAIDTIGVVNTPFHELPKDFFAQATKTANQQTNLQEQEFWQSPEYTAPGEKIEQVKEQDSDVEPILRIKKLHPQNPYADPGAVDIVSQSILVPSERKTDDLDCELLEKKQQYETYRASLPASPCTPKPSHLSAYAQVHPQDHEAVPPPAPAAKQHPSPALSQHTSVAFPPYDSPYSPYSPATSLYTPRADSPYSGSVSTASPYPGYAPAASPYPGYAPAAFPCTPGAASPYPGYAPATTPQLSPPESFQPANPSVSQFSLEHTMQSSPVVNKVSTPREASEIPLALVFITRGIGNKPTSDIYQAAMDIKQQIHDWHTERDRLWDVMVEKKQDHIARHKSMTRGLPDKEPLRCLEERESRKKLMARIKSFEKKFDKVNVELQKRGVTLPL